MAIFSDEYWMQQAFLLAKQAQALGEVPVGAIVVLNDEVIGRGFNQPIRSSDPCAHAEIIAIRDAASNIDNYRLVDADLYVTLEPCSMCAGAMIHARIRRLVFAASEPKAGVAHSQMALFDSPFVNHNIKVVSGVMKENASALLSDFFKERRQSKRTQ